MSSSNLANSYKSWKNLNNYEKERIQLAYIVPLIIAEARNHSNVEVHIHFRTKHGKATDCDIILLKDGKVKTQIELSHLWPTTFKNVEYALNPRRKALFECPRAKIASSFKSYYIQNGGRYDSYIRDACKDNRWTLMKFPMIHNMKRADLRRLKKIVHHIIIHTTAEERHVYDKNSSVDYKLVEMGVDLCVDVVSKCRCAVNCASDSGEQCFYHRLLVETSHLRTESMNVRN